MDMNPQTLAPLIALAIVLPIVLLRNRKPRPLNVNWMWVMPLLVTIFIGTGIWASTTYQPHAPFGPVTYASLAAALLAGCAIGWWRGKTIDIHRDAATGKLMAQASPAGLIFIISLFVIRRAADAWLTANAEAWHLNLAALSDGFLLFAAGLVVVSRVEMWIRARAIAEHPEQAIAA